MTHRLIGTVIVLGAFLFLAYRGFRIASRSADPFGALLAMGITCWICFQAFVNMAVVAQVIPFTGQTLPFISYGGSSLAMCLFAVGVLLNVSKHVEDAAPALVAAPEPRPQARKRRAVALFPSLAALWRGHRRPRVSRIGGRFRLARPVAREAVTVPVRGWRRWSARRPKRGRGPSPSGGNWRRP